MGVIADALAVRPRRLRGSGVMRNLLQEQVLTVFDVIMPIFVKSGVAINQAISSMPGQYQYSLDQLPERIKFLQDQGVQAVILFGVVDAKLKDNSGSVACKADGLVQQAIQLIKQMCPDWLVIVDLCFCEYTDHGHCGVLTADHQLDNDATLPHLAAQAVSLAQAGADVVAPSGMLDGMVATIRHALDAHGLIEVSIMSYAVKYASSLYGPFREAAEGAPSKGDRRGYQMQVANGFEAELEAELDIAQGADMLLVKPAYNDIVYRINHKFPATPVGAYHVSGQYAMIKAAVERGWLDELQVVEETMLGLKRAGARFIITYYADLIAKYIANKGGGV